MPRWIRVGRGVTAGAAVLFCARIVVADGGAGGLPVTASEIDTTSDGRATVFEPQRAIWQNPRGLRSFYAIIQRGGAGGLQLSRSLDGTAWSSVAQLNAGTSLSASAYPYDDGTQLVVYVAYAGGGSSFTNGPIFYRRLLIPDGASDPTIGPEQNTSRRGDHVSIARDRNGFVHIAKWGINSASVPERGTGIFGSSAANPGDSPAWSASTDVMSNVGVASWVDATPELAAFPSGNILGLVACQRNGPAGSTDLYGKDVVSFNGATYALGAQSAVDGPGTGSNAYHPFNLVVDDSGTAHVHYVFIRATSGITDDERYKKAKAAGTVQSWNPAVILKTAGVSTLSRSVALSIDRTVVPNQLYAFAHEGTDSLVRWFTSSAESTGWSAQEGLDGGGSVGIDHLQSARELVACGIPLIFTRQAGPFSARFASFPGCADSGTPTLTPTPAGPTASPTNTPTPTPTGQATSTPTRTPTSPPASGCDMHQLDGTPRVLDFSGTEYADCMTEVLRANDMNAAYDMGPTLRTAVNFTGPSTGIGPAAGPSWLTVYDQATYGEVTVSAAGLILRNNGKKCVGVALDSKAGPGKKAVAFKVCDSGNPGDSVEWGTVDTKTGAWTTLNAVYLGNRLNLHINNADCDLEPDGSYHMACDWLTITGSRVTNPDATITLTGTVFEHTNKQDPYSPLAAQVGPTLVWTGNPPAGVDSNGSCGLYAYAYQTNVHSSMTALNCR